MTTRAQAGKNNRVCTEANDYGGGVDAEDARKDEGGNGLGR
jgi:hypothetical protein